MRTFENYSWSFEGDYRFIALRDQFSRDTQLAQGQQGERGDFYHLYINGEYWGLFNTDERPEASFGETYFGGNKEDYDVVKVDTGGSLEAVLHEVKKLATETVGLKRTRSCFHPHIGNCHGMAIIKQFSNDLLWRARIESSL